MKILRNAAICLVIFAALTFTALSIVYKVNVEPVDKNDKREIEVVIPSGAVANDVGKILEEKKLIRSANFFKLYLKLYNKGNFKASTYQLNKAMDMKTIVELLEKGNNINQDEVHLTFKPGTNFRKIAKEIADNTKNTEEDVFAKLEDTEYLDKIIAKYWFITDDIKNDSIYYSLEGYLYPDTYYFYSDSSVEDIFNRLLNSMEKALEPYKEDIRNSKYTVHELLTVASMAEKEIDSKDEAKQLEYRKNVTSTFYNRLNKKMNLGSDVTTRYGIKLDEGRPMTAAEYADEDPYNTRRQDFLGLPVGPICMVTKSSIEAAVKPNETDFLYFISNIQTKETFFYEKEKDFFAKKNELASVNQGY